MPRPLRILMVSAEVETFARTGGLGDVVLGLSKALGRRGAEVVVVTPRYGITKVPAMSRPSWGAPTACETRRRVSGLRSCVTAR